MKTTCNGIGTQTALVPAKLSLPFVRFIRDNDDSVATKCEASKSSSLSGFCTLTTESAPTPCIFGNITLIDPQPLSTSNTTNVDSDVSVIETEVELDKSIEPPENEMSPPLAMRDAAFQNNATTKNVANLPRLGVKVKPNTNIASLVTKPEGQLETVPKEFEVTPRRSKTVTFADETKTIS